MAEALKGLSTIGTFLMNLDTDSAAKKIIDITSYPDLGGERNSIDITTLSDTIEQSIAGLQKGGTLQFDANYTKANWTAVKALEDGNKHTFGVYFDSNATGLANYVPTGDSGKFKFSGELSCYVNGGNTNEARKMTIIVYLQSEIETVE